jgi:hypothetical protein
VDLLARLVDRHLACVRALESTSFGPVPLHQSPSSASSV